MPEDFAVQNAAFVARLAEVCRDRGLRAQLRRYWSAANRHDAFPVLGRLGALDRWPRTILAALFAVHASDRGPAHVENGPSVGTAALRLAGGSTKSEGFDSMERHFRRLLASGDPGDLAAQLHRLVKRLEREGIPLDYARLLGELRQFRGNPERVKTRWALDFWQAATPEAGDARCFT